MNPRNDLLRGGFGRKYFTTKLDWNSPPEARIAVSNVMRLYSLPFLQFSRYQKILPDSWRWTQGMIFYAGDLSGNVSGLRNPEFPQRKANIRSTIIRHFPVKAIITVEKSPNVSDSIALVHCSRLCAYENLWDQLQTESSDFVSFKKRWGDNLEDLDSTRS